MEIVSHIFPVAARQGEEILLMPVGDIQWSGSERTVALGMLQRHIQWGVDHGAYFLGMGDYIDYLSPSNRHRLRSAALYDTAVSVHDSAAQELIEEIFDKALKPSVGRWLGLLEGHHYYQFESGITTDQMLAEKLKTKFLGTSTYIRMQFTRSTHKTPEGSVLVWAHHGVGGGARAGGPLNKLELQIIGREADIYLIGHVHKKVGAPIDRVEPYFPRKGEPQLIHRTKIIASTGSFLKGEVVGARQGGIPRGGYAEQGMMPPIALGGIIVKIRPRWVVKDGAELWLPDLNVEQ